MTPSPWVAEYIWVSGKNTYTDIRSKYKTVTNIEFSEATLDKMSKWNFDGSSTGQTHGKNTEIVIYPVAMYPHPFMKRAKVVLCECYHTDGSPTLHNTRKIANDIFNNNLSDLPWFGLEQEYFFFKDGHPFAWPQGGFPAAQADYYCGNGRQVCGRSIALQHYELCLEMGLKISGVNAEVAPAQWEFQIGPCVGIEAGDHMVVARWVFQKLGEQHDIDINYDPKPIKGDWNGSGCHMNFSTASMRAPGGLKEITAACERLSKTFVDDVKFYGGDNDQRMTGHHETSKLSEFTYGIGTRHTSVRIGNDVAASGKGYFEDRRPAANIDPYLATARFYTSSMGYPGPSVSCLEPQPWWSVLEKEASSPRTNPNAAKARM